MTTWHKSSHSAESANCVEVADLDGTVGVRDSKDPTGPVLTFDRGAWAEFVRAVGEGAFDRTGDET